MDNKCNIILYFSDQQRWDTVTDELTPCISALAAEGVKFNRNYTCQPVCGPARACLQTGVFATRNGCYRNAIALPEDSKTIAHYLNEAGYETAYIGKWHLASDSFGVGVHCETTAVPEARRGGYKYWRAADVLEFTSHGYDGYVFDENGNKLEFTGYRADAINEFALEFLDKRDTSKPFFMMISQLEPHHQNDHHAFEGYKETVDNYRDFPIPEDLSFLSGDYTEAYPDYLSAINRLDHNVGRLCERLKEKGLYDNTVIIYTSDHGCHFKTRNIEYKRTCHENTVKTPLVIRGGGFNGGVVTEKLTGLIDLPATVLSLAGIPVPEEFAGLPLEDILTGKAPERKSMFIQISESQCGRAVVTEKYKYSVRAATFTGYLSASSPVYFEDYLYDLESDPCEKNNLVTSPEYSDVRRELKKELLAQMAAAGEKISVIIPAVRARKK